MSPPPLLVFVSCFLFDLTLVIFAKAATCDFPPQNAGNREQEPAEKERLFVVSGSRGVVSGDVIGRSTATPTAAACGK